jgi:anti-anti-sigma factor
MGIGLQIDLEEVGRQIILRIDGRLDAAAAPILEKKVNGLIDENHYHLLFDMSNVDYMSSAALRVFLAMSKKVHGKKGDLILFSLTDDVEEIVKMAGFDRILHTAANEKEALQRYK